MFQLNSVKTPFKSPTGDIYLQVDGVSMGSPLGPLFANFYMCHIENSILPTLSNPPLIYTRYVDDIFLIINSIKTLEEIKSKFENLSILKFTYEIEQKKKLAFLDVEITRTNNLKPLSTAVHRKETNSDECINYHSIAPEQYKTGVIKTFLHRAYKVCNNWFTFHQEIERIKQILTNNNFPMSLIERTINKFLTNKQSQQKNFTAEESNHIQIFYRNQMSSQYKQEENNLRKIVTDHLTPTNPDETTKLQIYYRNKKLKNLLIKNNLHQPEKQQVSHVVYEYQCPREACQPSTYYVGYTECTLIDRLRNHAQNGSIQQHNSTEHSHKITTQEILNDTTIVRKQPTKEELIITEALIIKKSNPSLNNQREGEVRVLQIF